MAESVSRACSAICCRSRRRWRRAMSVSLPGSMDRKQRGNAMGDVTTASPSIQELEVLIRARYPVIYVVTWEETRVEEALAQIARRREKKIYLWSVARGIQPYGAAPDGKRRGDDRTADPAVGLDQVLESMEN